MRVILEWQRWLYTSLWVNFGESLPTSCYKSWDEGQLILKSLCWEGVVENIRSMLWAWISWTILCHWTLEISFLRIIQMLGGSSSWKSINEGCGYFGFKQRFQHYCGSTSVRALPQVAIHNGGIKERTYPEITAEKVLWRAFLLFY